MNKKNLGNILILLSFFILFFIYFPILRAYFLPPQTAQAANDKGAFIKIPKLEITAPVILNVDPFNKKEYITALEEGVAQAKGTSLPGQEGTIFLFAHSSDDPWHISQYNTIFFRLGELNAGDPIFLISDNVYYLYKVREKKIVSPSEVNYLKDQKENQLILQTCFPPGTDFKRLLIFADPI